MSFLLIHLMSQFIVKHVHLSMILASDDRLYSGCGNLLCHENDYDVLGHLNM